MKIFALDTSSSVLALGMMEDDQIRGELMQNKALTHSEHLMPHIDYLLSSLEENVREMDLFATTIGPGSFTGIRIGVATANAFALASGKKVVGISTLEALAYNFEHSDAIIITTMYAQREDYYRGIYRFEDGELVVIEEEAAVAKDDILQEASLFADAEVIIAGELADALRLDHWSQLQNQNDDTVFFAKRKSFQ